MFPQLSPLPLMTLPWVKLTQNQPVNEGHVTGVQTIPEVARVMPTPTSQAIVDLQCCSGPRGAWKHQSGNHSAATV